MHASLEGVMHIAKDNDRKEETVRRCDGSVHKVQMGLAPRVVSCTTQAKKIRWPACESWRSSLRSKDKTTPLVHPKPTWGSYSPPPPPVPGLSALYFSDM
mmetsp:Transcript_27685/g.41882  ORF Transcript_27685/g.41882 Transcript_27685/m.41882 type:complete len:100 (+) Transcript_27685:383-682(+)